MTSKAIVRSISRCESYCNRPLYSIFVRSFSGSVRLCNHADVSQEKPKELSYQKALTGIRNRKLQYMRILDDTSYQLPVVKSVVSLAEFSSDLSPGLLVESKSFGSCLILKVSSYDSGSSEKPILVLTDQGEVKECLRSEIEFSIFPLTSADSLSDSVKHTAFESGVTLLSASIPVHETFVGVLRKFSTSSNTVANAQINNLESFIKQLSHEANISQTFSLFELAQLFEEFCNNENTLKTPLFKFPPLPSPSQVSSTGIVAIYRLLTKLFNDSVIVKSPVVTILSPSLTKHFKRSLKVLPSLIKTQIPEMQNVDRRIVDLVASFARGEVLNEKLQSQILLFLQKFQPVTTDQDESLRTSQFLRKTGSHIKKGPSYDSEFLAFVRQKFPAHTLNITQSDSLEKLRTRWEGSAVYCIDGQGAREIDDGISLQIISSDCWRIGIHVADPVSALFHHNSFANDVLEDQRATAQKLLQRGFSKSSSVYYADDSHSPLFPSEFSSIFDLNKPNSRSISVQFDWNPYSQEINFESVKIAPFHHDNPISLTYDDADLLLKEERSTDLNLMMEVAKALKETRMKKDALDINIPSPQMSQDGEWKAEIPVESSSQQLVAEFMIAANTLIAKYCEENNLPIIYRGQLCEENNLDNKGDSKSLCTSLKKLKYLRPAILSTKPKPHKSLGHSIYTHATSPLRRFQDFVLHWQLHSHFISSKLLDEEQIEKVIAHIGPIQSLLKKANRDAITYWTLKYLLDAKKTGENVIFIPVLEAFQDSQKVFIPEIGVYGSVEGNFPLFEMREGTIADIHPEILMLKVKAIQNGNICK